MDTASMYADFAQRHNKLHQTIKSLSASDKAKEKRICELEKRIKDLEDISEEEIGKKVDQIVKRLVILETKTSMNQEKMKNMETIVKEIKSEKKAELESVTEKIKRESEILQKGIHDLDEQISNLDNKYQSIKEMTNSEETSKTVNIIQSDLFSMKTKLEA